MDSDDNPQTEDALISITPAPARRAVTLAMLYSLAGLLLYIAFTQPPASLALLAFILLLAAAVLWLAVATMRATCDGLVLTREVLRTEAGHVLCRVEDVAVVERGAFAFKPSGGFLVRLKSPATRGWAPGMWWRFGRSLGIGGAINAGAAKAMAELLSELARGETFDFRDDD